MTDPDRSRDIEGPGDYAPLGDGATGEDRTGKDGSGSMIRNVESLLGILAPVTADGGVLWFRGHRDSS